MNTSTTAETARPTSSQRNKLTSDEPHPYEIDLSTSHAKELRTALARYIEAGRRVTGTTRRAGHNGRKAPGNGVSNTEVRAWAKTQGLEVKERGRIPAEVIAQYQAAAGQ